MKRCNQTKVPLQSFENDSLTALFGMMANGSQFVKNLGAKLFCCDERSFLGMGDDFFKALYRCAGEVQIRRIHVTNIAELPRRTRNRLKGICSSFWTLLLFGRSALPVLEHGNFQGKIEVGTVNIAFEQQGKKIIATDDD